ncbi:MAG: hypothetical protein JSS07_06330, partial [Proteobacteria bacterium]|nr:hypothetical protein [Pseudomonadota bacterium]
MSNLNGDRRINNKNSIENNFSVETPKKENSEYSFYEWIKSTFSFSLDGKATSELLPDGSSHKLEQISNGDDHFQILNVQVPKLFEEPAQLIDNIKSEIPLSLEEIEKMKEAEAGEADDGNLGDSFYILYGMNYVVQSVPRDLGIGPFGTEITPVFTPVIPQVESTPPDNGVLITDLTPKLDGGDTVVDEDDLLAIRGPNKSEGSDPTKESTTVEGNFKISAPDGVGSLNVGGSDIILNNVFTPTVIVTPLGNLLSFISYVAATGVITYQYTLVDNENHPPGNGENDLFEDFPVTLKDTDGDTASDTLSVRIIDDVPSIQASEKNETLIVDESNFSNNATGSFAKLFTAIPGADGANNTHYTLGVTEGANSGLTDTLSNKAVLLFLESGSVVGRIDGPAGDIVFTISIDANTGDVTLDQSRAVVHNNPNDPDESSSPAMLADASLISISATLTDNDGDVATASRNIGDAFRFEDDGPSIHNNYSNQPTLIVDETNFAIDASASFAG